MSDEKDKPQEGKSDQAQQNGKNKRQHARVDFFSQVKVKTPEDDSALDVFAANVSQGGIFLRSNQPLPEGKKVELEFEVEQGPVKVDEGEVVWSKEFEPISIDGTTPGMGVRFDKIDQGSQQNIGSFIDEVLGSDGEDLPPPPVDLQAMDTGPLMGGRDKPGEPKLVLPSELDKQPTPVADPPLEPVPLAPPVSTPPRPAAPEPKAAEPKAAEPKAAEPKTPQPNPSAEQGEAQEQVASARMQLKLAPPDQAPAPKPIEKASEPAQTTPKPAPQAAPKEDQMAAFSKPPAPKTRMLLFVGFVILVAAVTFMTLIWLKPFDDKGGGKSGQPKPVADQPQPVADQPKPVADQPKPVADQPKPVADQAKPVADQAQPVADQPKPVTDQPKPVADQAKPAPGQASLNQPQFKETAQGWQIKLPLSSKVKIKHFTLKNPPRLAIDLKNCTWSGGKQLSPPMAQVKKIRFGEQADGIRLVFDFAGQTIPQHKIDKTGTGVTVTLLK